jgi:hypothetical protein
VATTAQYLLASSQGLFRIAYLVVNIMMGAMVARRVRSYSEASVPSNPSDSDASYEGWGLVRVLQSTPLGATHPTLLDSQSHRSSDSTAAPGRCVWCCTSSELCVAVAVATCALALATELRATTVTRISLRAVLPRRRPASPRWWRCRAAARASSSAGEASRSAGLPSQAESQQARHSARRFTTLT